MSVNDLTQLSKEQLIDLVIQQHELAKQKSFAPHVPPEPGITEGWCCPVGLLFASRERWLEFKGNNHHLEQNPTKLLPPPCANKVIEAGLETELEEIMRTYLNGQRQQWERVTREALRHLDDVAFLRQSPLLGAARMHRVNLDGLGLQQKLQEAIEAIGASHPYQPHWALRRTILSWTYLDKKKSSEILPNLSISERQYYRELKTAIRAVLEYILSSAPTVSA